MTERQAYSRHGLNVLKARVKVRGLQAIDRRTAAARALLNWRKELVADLGGPEAISAAQSALIEATCRTKLFLDSPALRPPLPLPPPPHELPGALTERRGRAAPGACAEPPTPRIR